MLKIFVCVFVLVLNVTPSYEREFSRDDVPCLSYGGICVPPGDCPAGKQLKIQGLCLRRKSAFECCYSLPISETRCRSKGGQCFPKNYECPEKLTFNEATDCDNDEKCCILVK